MAPLTIERSAAINRLAAAIAPLLTQEYIRNLVRRFLPRSANANKARASTRSQMTLTGSMAAKTAWIRFLLVKATNNLSFRYLMSCNDTITFDWFTVSLKDNTTQQTSTILANTCVNDDTWRKIDYQLSSSLAGHSLTLTFTNSPLSMTFGSTRARR